MDTGRFVGTLGVRLATATLAAICAAGAFTLGRPDLPGRGVLLAVTFVAGFLALVGFIHCFRAIYDRWLVFTRVLHTVVTTVLFGACYLLVVPLFWLITLPFDLLRVRRRPAAESFWVEKPGKADPSSFQRMG